MAELNHRPETKSGRAFGTALSRSAGKSLRRLLDGPKEVTASTEFPAIDRSNTTLLEKSRGSAKAIHTGTTVKCDERLCRMADSGLRENSEMKLGT
jgi:hypothetical protein